MEDLAKKEEQDAQFSFTQAPEIMDNYTKNLKRRSQAYKERSSSQYSKTPFVDPEDEKETSQTVF